MRQSENRSDLTVQHSATVTEMSISKESLQMHKTTKTDSTFSSAKGFCAVSFASFLSFPLETATKAITNSKQGIDGKFQFTIAFKSSVKLGTCDPLWQSIKRLAYTMKLLNQPMLVQTVSRQIVLQTGLAETGLVAKNSKKNLEWGASHTQTAQVSVWVGGVNFITNYPFANSQAVVYWHRNVHYPQKINQPFRQYLCRILSFGFKAGHCGSIARLPSEFLGAYLFFAGMPFFQVLGEDKLKLPSALSCLFATIATAAIITPATNPFSIYNNFSVRHSVFNLNNAGELELVERAHFKKTYRAILETHKHVLALLYRGSIPRSGNILASVGATSLGYKIADSLWARLNHEIDVVQPVNRGAKQPVASPGDESFFVYLGCNPL